MNDAELDSLLRHARNADPGLKMNREFRKNVWLRIETAESAAWTHSIRRFCSRIAECLTLPAVAAGTCAAAVITGLLLGSLDERADAGNEAAYLHSVSPFVQQLSR